MDLMRMLVLSCLLVFAGVVLFALIASYEIPKSGEWLHVKSPISEQIDQRARHVLPFFHKRTRIDGTLFPVPFVLHRPTFADQTPGELKLDVHFRLFPDPQRILEEIQSSGIEALRNPVQLAAEFTQAVETAARKTFPEFNASAVRSSPESLARAMMDRLGNTLGAYEILGMRFHPGPDFPFPPLSSNLLSNQGEHT